MNFAKYVYLLAAVGNSATAIGYFLGYIDPSQVKSAIYCLLIAGFTAILFLQERDK